MDQGRGALPVSVTKLAGGSTSVRDLHDVTLRVERSCDCEAAGGICLLVSEGSACRRNLRWYNVCLCAWYVKGSI